MSSVGRYYDEKTNRIIEKYGSAVRIHYHTGIFNESYYNGTRSTKSISTKMHEFQEKILELQSDYIPKLERPCIVLDVGCGLGGGALFWASEYSAKVTAITIAENHIDVIKNCAKKAKVEHLVNVLLQDAHTMPGENEFDMVVAIESSCYLNRRLWFQRMYEILRRGGIIQICDWFVDSDELKENFRIKQIEEHWKTDMGTLAEYQNEAKLAGFKKIEETNLNERSSEFWSMARDWNEEKKKEKELAIEEIERLNLSSERLKELQNCFEAQQILHEHLVFQK